MTEGVFKGDINDMFNKKAVADALREPDFLKRAHKLVNLEEDIATAYSRDADAIEDSADTTNRKGSWKRFLEVGAKTGIPVGVVFFLWLWGPAAPVELLVSLSMTVGALIGSACGVVASARTGSTEAEERFEKLNSQTSRMEYEIESSIRRMERDLRSQPEAVRKECREIFQEAAVRRDRHRREEHYATMEDRAEETASTLKMIGGATASSAALLMMNK